MARGKVIFLGTSAGIPTAERSLPSIALIWKGEVILFDAGEGSQHNMIKAGISPLKISKVLITHRHGDHILGLPGLLMTMALMGREQNLRVYGPKGISQFLNCVLPAIHEEELDFKVEAYEIESEGVAIEEDDYQILAAPASHSVETWAFKFIEKDRPGRFDEEEARKLGIPEGPLRRQLIEGKAIEFRGKVIAPEMIVGEPRPGFKMVYTGDTTFSESLVEFSKGVDVLIHDSTFESSKTDSADRVKHSTAKDAAMVAASAGAKKLILTHLSARYQEAQVMIEDAKGIFRNIEVAQDLMELPIE